MAIQQTKTSDIVLSVPCEYLKINVILDRPTWHGKILKTHKEVDNRLPLVEKILSLRSKDDILLYRKRDDPDKVAIFYECLHLQPYNKYIKIGINLKSGKIRTIHGDNNLPASDYMERIK